MLAVPRQICYSGSLSAVALLQYGSDAEGRQCMAGCASNKFRERDLGNLRARPKLSRELLRMKLRTSETFVGTVRRFSSEVGINDDKTGCLEFQRLERGALQVAVTAYTHKWEFLKRTLL